MGKRVTEDELLKALIEHIKSFGDRFRATPYLLFREVCRDRFDADFAETEIDEMDLFFKLSDAASSNGFSLRSVPSKEEKWGLPYNFEYFFYPARKERTKLQEKNEPKTQGENDQSVIILSRMYVGSYLEEPENIGHEVINLFKDDNGNNYIYVNEDGRINPQYNNAVRAVLLVKYIEKGVMEVVAKAEELEQIVRKTGNRAEEVAEQVKYVENHQVTYGGVSIYRIHNGTDDENITITFKTGRLRLPANPLFLIEDKEKVNEYETYVLLPEKHFSSQSLKMYYTEKALPKDYKALMQMLADEKYWEKENTTSIVDLSEYDPQNNGRGFLSIIKKENDELVYSNLLAYFFERNRSVFLDFAKKVLGVDGLKRDYRIIRESKYHTDLWIEDEHSIILIENKIKSKINGEQHDLYGDKVQSQLKQYYDAAYTESKDKNKALYCYIFIPDYNFINLSKFAEGDHYKMIKYSHIYDFYYSKAGDMLNDTYFTEFLSALRIHSKTVDNHNFDVMKDRFMAKIKKIRESQ